MTDTLTPEKREAAQRGVELLTRDRDCMVECNSHLTKDGDEFKPVPGTLDPDCEDDFRDYNAAIEAIPALLSALDAAIERAEKAEALIDRLRREAEQHAQEARTANATIAEIYQAVTDATGEPGNWNGAEPVRARLTALKARVAELEGALTEISKQTYGTEISMDGDERAEILGRHLAMRRSIAFTALKKDTPND